MTLYTLPFSTPSASATQSTKRGRFVLLFRRGTLDFDFAFADSMCFIPMNLCTNDTTVRQANLCESFQLSLSSVTPVEPPQIAYTSIHRNDFDVFQVGYKFDLRPRHRSSHAGVPPFGSLVTPRTSVGQ
jgi:hypothetical protein